MTRPSELRELTDDELDHRLTESRQELFNLRFQSVTGALENSARLKLFRHGRVRQVPEEALPAGTQRLQQGSAVPPVGVNRSRHRIETVWISRSHHRAEIAVTDCECVSHRIEKRKIRARVIAHRQDGIIGVYREA